MMFDEYDDQSQGQIDDENLSQEPPQYADEWYEDGEQPADPDEVLPQSEEVQDEVFREDFHDSEAEHTPSGKRFGITMMLPIDSITIPEGRRTIKDISELTASIHQVGLLNPIVVSEDPAHTLIAGRKRLSACRLLRWPEVPVTIVSLDALHRELAEIDENVVRYELTVVERGDQLKRRKVIYEALHPETKAGNVRANGMNRTLGNDVDEIISSTFTEDTAAKTGVSPRTVQQEVQIADRLSPRAKEAMRDTPLADQKVELLKLVRLKEDRQEKIVEKLVSGDAKSVAEANRSIENEEKRQALKIKAEAAPTVDTWEIIEGDCRNVLQTLPQKSARLVFADPPYNMKFDYRVDGHDDNMSVDKYDCMIYEFIEAAIPILADDGSLWVLIDNPNAWRFEQLILEAGLFMRNWITWYESFGWYHPNNFARTSRRLLYAVKDPHRFVFNHDAVLCPNDRSKRGGKRATSDEKLWGDVWGIDPPINRVCGNFHERVPDAANQLPLDLLRPIIGCASDPGDLVIDAFCGSGTTGVAALELGRRFIGIEKDPKYVKLSQTRILAASG